MIKWVHHWCTRWAAGIRLIVYGKKGHPPQHALTRLIELGFVSALRFEHPDCDPGRADPHTRRMHRAVRKLSRVHRDILFTHYVLDGTAIDKARTLGISRRAYYARLDAASRELSKWLEDS